MEIQNKTRSELSSQAHKLKRKIKGINIKTNDVEIFESKSQAAKFYRCSPALVYLICEGITNTKTFSGTFTFEYAEQNDPVSISVADSRIGRSKYVNEEEKRNAINKSRREKLHNIIMYKNWLKDFKYCF